MIVTSIIAALMLALMLYGHVPTAVLALLCAAVVIGASMVSKHGAHRHDFMEVDVVAHGSRLGAWNAGLKVCLCIVLVIVCVAANSLPVAVALLVGMSAVSLWSSRIGFARYCALLVVPVLFVSLSGIVLLVDVAPVPKGGLCVPLFGWCLCVTPESQFQTLMVIVKAVGSLACLYALALSTPVHEITGFMRRLHVPGIVLDLAVLIYRYISILVSSLYQMSVAAKTRLGENSYRAKWRSFAGIASNLLVRSFSRAGRSFDAMEARACAEEIRFEIKERPVTALQVWASLVLAAFLCAIYFCGRMWA